MIDAIVHILFVILSREEEEQLVAVVVEVRSRNYNWAPDLSTGVKVLCLRTRDTRVLVLRIIGVQMPTTGIDVSLAVELLTAGFANRADNDRTLCLIRTKVRGHDFQFRGHVRVGVHSLAA